jgi:Ca2+-binding RTX toxin-like protein
LIEGSSGADTLTGGEGADTLTGGSGVDVFRWPGEDGGDDDDIITDFLSGTDKLAIEGFQWGVSEISYSNGRTTAIFDVDDNGSDDLEINFSRSITLSQNDFVSFT